MSKFKKLVFFNHFHNGDVFVSRTLVKQIVDSGVAEEYFYATHSDPKLLQDIDLTVIPVSDLTGIIFSEFDGYDIRKNTLSLIKESDAVYINTWYRVSPVWENWRVGLQSLIGLFKEYHKLLDIPWKEKDPHQFLPKVDFNKFEFLYLKEFLTNFSKGFTGKILVSNGKCLSGQCENFNMNTAINNLANRFPNYLFILTNNKKDPIDAENIIYASDICKNPKNLMEISYISTMCDIIIGRASGGYTFAHLQQNFTNARQVFGAQAVNAEVCQFLHREPEYSSFIFNGLQNNDGTISLISDCIKKSVEVCT